MAFPPISRHAPVLGEVHLAPVNCPESNSPQFIDRSEHNCSKYNGSKYNCSKYN